MNPPLRSAFLLVLLFSTLPSWAATASPATAVPAPTEQAKSKQWLIVLRVVPRLQEESAWSDADRALVGKHFVRLQAAAAKGQVILAGRTSEDLKQTMGLIVFEASDEAEARAFMNGDPCVAGGVMTGELHPYDIALLRKS